jgi:hypothetical protein
LGKPPLIVEAVEAVANKRSRINVDATAILNFSFVI